MAFADKQTAKTYSKKEQKLWIWKAFDRDSRQLIDWELGTRDAETLAKPLERLARWDVAVYCTDDGKAYSTELEKLCPAAHHLISKSETVAIERNNSDNRHGFGRLHRRTKIVSKSIQMVDLTMALFARFRANKHYKTLRNLRLSLLA